MKMFLFSTALVLVACSKVDASEALLFNSGGYTIEVLIGFLDDPVIAQVHFTPPGAKDWVSLRRELLRIEKFDMKKRILIMHFSNKSDPDLPASFSFSANKTRAVLSAATTGNPFINVSWGGATVFSHLVNAGTGYTEFTFNQTASNSLTVLSFFTGGSFTNLFLDDVSVEPAGVGVPDGGSTVSLLGLASLGLVALRRKLRC